MSFSSAYLAPALRLSRSRSGNSPRPTVHLDEPIDGERMNAWLSTLLREQGTDIFRMKGIVNVAGSDKRLVFQGVHMLLDASEDRTWGSDKRSSDLIFIGRKLDRTALTHAFEQCRAR